MLSLLPLERDYFSFLDKKFTEFSINDVNIIVNFLTNKTTMPFRADRSSSHELIN